MYIQNEQIKAGEEKFKEKKSIFDDSQFKYLKIPVEILILNDLNCADKIILARIHYWTQRNLPCYETNEKLGELIGRSVSQTSRIIRKLKRKGYIEVLHMTRRTRQIYSEINTKTEENKCNNAEHLRIDAYQDEF